MRALATASCLVVLIALMAVPRPASADGEDGSSSNTLLETYAANRKYEATLTSAQEVAMVKGPGAPAWLRACSWDDDVTNYDVYLYFHNYITNADPLTPTEFATNGEDPDEQWAIIYCPATPTSLTAAPQIGYTGAYAAWAVGGPPPQLVLDLLIARAYASVELPTTTGTSSPPGDTTIPMITQLPTWLWIDNTTWNANYTATTPPLYGTTATVTATPVNVTFEADNQTIDCGPNTGTPYDLTKDEDDQTTNCSLTYNHASVPADHYLQATITWTATYTCNQYCGTGTLPNYTITTRRPVTVEQWQVVNS